ncbi:hypothetical protein NUH88_17215 [Nisaea acidiphila]|uniref:Secreted protein n=1 Tax=Nisaea acidiphila TaxID=1862145 RepID=A0A9J7ANB1_9PROT|nr:hypothetical protein [Nisaea acidiphila]UUX49131.1 hypothetical protein NUH88_17215 [Nisaea acidiphila]
MSISPKPLWRRLAGRCLLATALLSASPLPALAVTDCEALTLYGNAMNQRLCRTLSPTTQNLWVCGLTTGATDVHITFNRNTPLHLTVRVNPGNPTCQGNTPIGGAFPGAMTMPGAPAQICGVNTQNWLNRLNAVAQMPAGAHTLCRAPFIAMIGSGRMTPGDAQTYLNQCDNGNAPPPPPVCP